MDFDPVLLARLQFAFTISFHIIFPSFTIGLAAYIATLLAIWLRSGEDRSPATKALRIRSTAGAIDGKSIATSSPTQRESSRRSSAARTTTESPPEGRNVMPDMALRVP